MTKYRVHDIVMMFKIINRTITKAKASDKFFSENLWAPLFISKEDKDYEIKGFGINSTGY